MSSADRPASGSRGEDPVFARPVNLDRDVSWMGGVAFIPVRQDAWPGDCVSGDAEEGVPDDLLDDVVLVSRPDPHPPREAVLGTQASLVAAAGSAAPAGVAAAGVIELRTETPLQEWHRKPRNDDATWKPKSRRRH